MADPEGNEFCVLDWHDPIRDTGPIATVVVDCAYPRAMARFWGQAMDWTVHKVTDHNAVLRSAQGVGPYLQFLRTPDVNTVWNASISTSAHTPATTYRPRRPDCGLSAPPPPPST